MNTTKADDTLFTLSNISTARLDYSFLSKPAGDSFEHATRISVLILSDTHIRVLFGVRLLSTEKHSSGTPVASCTAEILGDFQLAKPLGAVSSASDIRHLENMLAMLYPFIREKIYYCLSSNQMVLILPAINTKKLLEDQASKNVDITDSRKVEEPKPMEQV